MIFSAPHRVRFLLPGLILATVFAVGAVRAAPAKDDTPKSAKEEKASDKKAADKKKTHDAKAEKADKKPDQAKSASMGQFGDWGAYQTPGKQKTCYALAQPKTREPDKLKRDAAYVFISYRPAENVKNEISIIMGFAMKDGGEAQASIGDAEFGLIAKGANAWIKNPAEESHFIDAMKKGSKLVVKAASSKGKVSTDTYSLAGLSQALDKVRKECP
jgi:hypothetical protein